MVIINNSVKDMDGLKKKCSEFFMYNASMLSYLDVIKGQGSDKICSL